MNLAGVTPSVILSTTAGETPLAPLSETLSDGISSFPLATPDSSPLPDGAYTLTVDAVDSVGNVVSDLQGNLLSTSFIVDTVAPTLTFINPESAIVAGDGAGGTDTDPATPGFQTDVVVGVDDLGTSPSEVCVSFSTGGTTLCAPVSNGIATFTNATLQPGSNLLTAAATDQAGNSSSVPFAVSLDADFPAIQITAPFDGSVVATSTVDIAVTIGDSEGPRSPCSSGVATKWSADSAVPVQNSPGNYVFSGITLAPGANTFVVEAANGGPSGASSPVTVTYKDEAPVVTFVSPAASSVLNASASECIPGVNDCVTDVIASVENGEGADAVLEINCGSNSFSYDTSVEGGVATWAVTLPDQSTCTLVGSVEDEAGLSATTNAIELVIDRIAPVVVSIPAPADDLLQSFNDEKSGCPGNAEVCQRGSHGSGAGESVTVTISSETGEVFQTKEVLVVNSVPDSSSAQLSAGQFDFPDGTVVLTASTEDAAETSPTLSVVSSS